MRSNWQLQLDELPLPVVAHIQHLERMRRDFVGNVSHELRTPLTVIHGYLESLMESDDKPEWKKIFLQMYQQTLRMENLIDDLLLLSALENDAEQPPVDQIVNVAKLLQLVVEDARVLSGNAQHVFTLQLDEKLQLQGNNKELRSLFSNIIFNAVKYTPAKGAITICWKSTGKNALFEVTDTGIGIARQHIPRLTERFYRVDKARSRESGGTGLGLAIAKHVLLRHNGRLRIQSTPGDGSTFRCIFPARRIAKV